MNRTTAIVLGANFTHFVDAQIQNGHYQNVNEVIEAGLKLLQANEAKMKALQDALNAGLQSGEPRPFDSPGFLQRMHAKYDKNQIL